VLVANRGEIALRVIRACRELGLSPIAIYGEGEEQSAHVLAADDAYRIPDGAMLPYLNIPAIIEIAKKAGATMVHPGYGFLAENAAFAEAIREAGLAFAGPTPEAMRALGDKVAARKVAVRANVPIVPGTEDPVDTVEDARTWAGQFGYPVAVKAAGGGGGRGFRVAREAGELDDAYLGSAGEAQRYFANPTVFLERYLERPRHIEVQIIADQQGNVVALGERDCSVQRRHQKLIEETPSPAVTPEIREQLMAASVSLAREVDYTSAGTVEFMLAPDGQFYFLEMNTRIQVEHTITEMVTGFDLVKEQLRIAQGHPLSFTQADVDPKGHSIQCRINAEDAGRDFAPTPGTITVYREPGGFGVRIDSAMSAGAAISPMYDSLIAKLVVWGRDRTEAIARMQRALGEFQIEGVATTIPFHQNVLANAAFIAGDATTSFLPEHPEVIPAAQTPVAAAAEVDAPANAEALVEVNGRRFSVVVRGGAFAMASDPAAANGVAPGRRSVAKKGAKASAKETLESPIQGTIVRVEVAEGQDVTAGQLICVVEAMKMENELLAHRAGTVKTLYVKKGDAIKVGASVVEIS
jgi:acetyl-CoA/propionyl-CoA carboxylase biotin carboxyl carrier protein